MLSAQLHVAARPEPPPPWTSSSWSHDSWNKDLALSSSALSKITPSALARACAACVFASVARAKTLAACRSFSSAWSSWLRRRCTAWAACSCLTSASLQTASVRRTPSAGDAAGTRCGLGDPGQLRLRWSAQWPSSGMKMNLGVQPATVSG
eukprot:8583642-Pyramimonas_sp.AAC.1